MSASRIESVESNASSGGWSAGVEVEDVTTGGGPTSSLSSKWMRCAAGSVLMAASSAPVLCHGLPSQWFRDEGAYTGSLVVGAYSGDQIADLATADSGVQHASVQKAVNAVLDTMRDNAEDEGAIFNELQTVVGTYGEPAIEAVRQWLMLHRSRHERVATILGWLGYMHDAATKGARLDLLANMLGDQSPFVRDAAALALEELDDPRAIEPLQKAIEAERYSSLREEYAAIAASLRA